jgi:hypothetical protein
MAFEVSLDAFRRMMAAGQLSRHGYWLIRRETTNDPLTGKAKTEVFLYLYREDENGHLVFTRMRLIDIPAMYFPHVWELQDVEQMAHAIDLAFQQFAKEYMDGLVEAKRFVGIG